MKKWTVIILLLLSACYAGIKVVQWKLRTYVGFPVPVKMEVLGPFWIIGHATPKQKEEPADPLEREFRDLMHASGIVASVSPGNSATPFTALSGTPVSREVYKRLVTTGRYRGIRIGRQRCLVARHALDPRPARSNFYTRMVTFVRESARSISMANQMTRELETRNLRVPRTVLLFYTSPDPSRGMSIVQFAPLEDKN